ncbi:MAG: hydrogenase maturation protease [bacterium]
MKSCLIIGYGNTLRRDDGAGVRAAELLSKQFPAVDCYCSHQLSLEIAESLAEYSMVFFLDAIREGTEPAIQLLQPSEDVGSLSSHTLSPQQLLNTCLLLYKRAPRIAWQVGIPAVDFALGETCTEFTEQMIKSAVEWCGKRISEQIHNEAKY